MQLCRLVVLVLIGMLRAAFGQLVAERRQLRTQLLHVLAVERAASFELPNRYSFRPAAFPPHCSPTKN